MNGDTKWGQIADHYRAQIKTGELLAGDPLPPENEMAKAFGVARGTVRQAMAALDRDGLVYARPGSRTVAWLEPMKVHLARDPGRTWAGEAPTRGADSWGADMTEAGREPSQTISLFIDRASPPVAARLEAPVGTPILERRLTRHAGDRPHNLISFYFPTGLASGTPLEGPDSIEQGALAWLEQAHGPLTHDPPEVTARPPGAPERSVLRIPGGTPVLMVWRTSRANGRPVVASMAVYPGDRTILLVP